MAQNDDPSFVGVDRESGEPIALVGIGCRFPGGANGPQEFWRLLRDGVDAIAEVPADRFAIDEFYDPTPATPGKIVTRGGGFLDHIDLFDAAFFAIPPREAEAMDPQQRLLLEVAWEALEDSGQVPERLAGTPVGVFVGMCYNDYEDLMFEDPQGLDVYGITGGCRSVAAGRLSYALGLRGPSLAIDSACASSLVALHLACQSLNAGDCSLALAAGVNVILEPQISIGFSQAHMLAPDGRCKFCDRRADGFVRSEGVGVVVLKHLSRALADGDPIRAVIAGSAINNDGTSGESMMTPGREGQQAVLREACRRSRVSPSQVDYVEAHGTGTTVGDPVEVGNLGAVFGPGRDGRPLRIGSVKTNIGHTEGVAGVAGVIKVALSLEHGQIPASLHCEELNPEIPWSQLQVRVQRELEEWPAGGGRRRAGVSAFGINGSNVHVILEPAPAPAAAGEAEAGEHLLALSAHTPPALEELARSYRQWLRGEDAELPPFDERRLDAARKPAPEQRLGPREMGEKPPLRDVCFTAGERRTHHPHRLALVAADPAELGEQLEAFLAGAPAPGTASGARAAGRRPRVVFVFPGQGSQWPGMARELLEREPVFREHLERCDAAMQSFGAVPLVRALSAAEGQSQLERIDVVQPALCAIQIALAGLWRWWGVEPAAVVGQSMGEVAAAQVAGALSLEDAARIICRRSRLLRRTSGKGEMALVELSFADAERALEGREDRLSVAVSSGFRSTVVAGDPAALSELLEELGRREVFCRRIQVDVASHSPQMDDLRPDLLAALEGVEPRAGELPIYSTVAGRVVDGGELDAGYWVRNLRQPVRFTTALEQLVADGCDVFLEISPHPIVLPAVEQGLTDLGAEGMALASLRRQEPERWCLLESLAALYCRGQEIDWQRLNGGGGRCVRLPSYPWQRQRFWFRRSGGCGLSRVAGSAHPLLGGPGWSSSFALGTSSWQSAVGPELVPWLRDHRVRGTMVLPAAAYLEMVLAAVREAFGSGSHALEAVKFHHPVTFAEDGTQTLQLVISRAGPDAASFRLSSCNQGPAGESPGWTLHAGGSVRLAAPEAGERPICPPPGEPHEAPAAALPSAIRERCPQALAGDRLYELLKRRGLDYGPGFRGVEQVWRRDGEALGRLCRSEVVRVEAGAWTIHPALLDACFQVLVAALPEVGEGETANTWLPVGVDRFHLGARPGGDQELRSHACLRAAGDERDVAAGDVVLLDPGGRRLMVAEGLRLRRLEGDKDRDDLLYHLLWQSAARAPEPTAARGEEPGDGWLLFTDCGGVGAALAERLTAAGHSCLLVERGDAFAAPAAGPYQLDPARAEDYLRLLEEVHRAGPTTLRGVVYLWGLDLATAGKDDTALDPELELLSCGGVLHLVQALLAVAGAEPPRLWLVSAGSQCPDGEAAEIAVAQAPLWGLGGVIAQEHPALRCTRVDLEAAPEPAAAVMLSAELECDAEEDQIALRGEVRYAARLERGTGAAERPRPRVLAAHDEPFRVAMAEPGILENLELRAAARPGPAAGEVEIEVGAAGLNFHDVLMGMGLLPAESDEEPGWFGAECAGRIVAVGEGVAGLRIDDEVLAFADPAFARYVTTDARLVAPRPPALSLEEAAGVTAVFVTAYYGLHHLARLGPGERVLIHAASGGVGLAAIQVARWLGAEIFATAGTPEKREFLTRLGIAQVMDSRSLEFADQVRERTGGAGVDVVLSALVGEGAARSLSLLAPYGRFLEIGRRDLYENRALGLQPFLNNLSYFAIDVKALARQRPGLVGSLLREICAHFAGGTFQPLPVTVFPVSEAAAAFRHLAQARHTGKVVLSFRDREVWLSPSPAALRADGTYLITGGLGGLGLCFARWLVERGARHLVLVGRRGSTAAAGEHLKALAAAGAEVVTARADVADREALAAVVARIRETMPPLRGILHAAGLLDDGTLEQLDRERFRRVMAPKVDGSWNLHVLTREEPLEFFVLFSSAAALLGSAGQGNYAAANAFLDALAAQRRAWDLPAMSIAWGPWSQLGLAAAQENRGQRLAERGLGSFSPDRGLTAFAQLLEGDPIYAAVMPLEVDLWCRNQPATCLAFFERLRREAGAARPETGPAEGVREALAAATSEAERRELLESHVRHQLGQVLRLAPAEIEVDKPLRSLGLDSLMAMEIRNRLHAQLDADLPLRRLVAGPSIRELAADLLAQRTAALPRPSEIDPVPPDERRLAELSRGEGGPRPDPALQRLVEAWRQAPAAPVVALAGEVPVTAPAELADPYRLAHFLCRHRVTALLVSAASAQRLDRVLAAGAVPAEWLRLRRVVIVGQPPAAPEFLAGLCPLAVLLPVAAESGVALWAELVPAAPGIGFVGHPCPGRSLEIVDSGGRPVAIGVYGRLRPGNGRGRWRDDGAVEVAGADAPGPGAAPPRRRAELVPDRPYRAPRSAWERQLTAAWSQVLEVDRVGVDDDFEALGGSFETAVELSEHLAAADLLALPERIVEQRTVKRLAPVVERSMAAAGGDGSGPVALTARQRALLGAALEVPEAVVGSISFAARGPLEPKALAAALRLFTSRHDALRTRFVRHGTLWLGTCAEVAEDLLTVAEPGTAWSAAVAAERRRLDPLRGPQLRALLAPPAAGEPPRLALVFSRLAVDEGSLPILAAELAAAYRAAEAGGSAAVAWPVAAGSFHAWLRLAERLALGREPAAAEAVPAPITSAEWSFSPAAFAAPWSRRLAELAPAEARVLVTAALGRALHRAGLAEHGVVAVEDGRRYGPSALPELPPLVGQLGRRHPHLVAVGPDDGPAEVRKQLAASPAAAGDAEVAFHFVAGSRWLPNDLLELATDHRPPAPWAAVWPAPALRVLAISERESLVVGTLSQPERIAPDRVGELTRAWDEALTELLISSEARSPEPFNPQNVDLDEIEDFLDS